MVFFIKFPVIGLDGCYRVIENSINLLGHSRGGGISLLKTAEDSRISKVVSWASPSDLLRKLPSGDKLKLWVRNIWMLYLRFHPWLHWH
mgnify:CR=1 FL=1